MKRANLIAITLLLVSFVSSYGVASASETKPQLLNLVSSLSLVSTRMTDVSNFLTALPNYEKAKSLKVRSVKLTNVPPTRKGGVQPNQTVPEVCGSATFFMLDFGGGNAGFYWSATSSRGPMLAVGYNTAWQNYTNPISGNISDTVPASGASWGTSTTRFTRPGTVYGGTNMTIYYTDTTCYGNGLSDEIQVTN